MDLLSFIIGIVIGAAFSPFWMMVWARIKDFYQSKTAQSQTAQAESAPVEAAPAKKATRQRRAKSAE